MGEGINMNKEAKRKYRQELDSVVMMLMNSKSSSSSLTDGYNSTDSEIDIKFTNTSKYKESEIKLTNDSKNIDEEFSQNSETILRKSKLFIQINEEPIVLQKSNFYDQLLSSDSEGLQSSGLSDSDSEEESESNKEIA